MLNKVAAERHTAKLRKPLPICTQSGRYNGWAFRSVRTWINGALKNGNDSERKRDEATNDQITERITCFGFRRRASSEGNTLGGTKHRQRSVLSLQQSAF